MTTIENNKIIAEFMKWDILNDMTYSKATKGKWIELDKLKFHSNWNWLMEVVEKIESENFKNEAKNCVSFLVKTVNDNCQIVDLFKDRFEINIYAKTKIEAVYNACLEFIKWYNEQKSA